MAEIVIIGGHGKVALRLAPLLVEQGHEVTSVFRKPEQEEAVRKTGATPLVLDVENASTEEIAETIKGHDAIAWSAGAGGGNPDRTYAVDRDAAIRSMDAARQAGIRRYVMVSYIGSDPDHDVPEDSSFFPYAEAKAAADEYLRQTDLQWTILGPGRLTLDEPRKKINPDADPGAANRDTSRANVAHVIAAVLDEPATFNKTIDFIDGGTPIQEAIIGG